MPIVSRRRSLEHSTILWVRAASTEIPLSWGTAISLLPVHWSICIYVCMHVTPQVRVCGPRAAPSRVLEPAGHKPARHSHLRGPRHLSDWYQVLIVSLAICMWWGCYCYWQSTVPAHLRAARTSGQRKRHHLGAALPQPLVFRGGWLPRLHLGCASFRRERGGAFARQRYQRILQSRIWPDTSVQCLRRDQPGTKQVAGTKLAAERESIRIHGPSLIAWMPPKAIVSTGVIVIVILSVIVIVMGAGELGPAARRVGVHLLRQLRASTARVTAL